MSESTFWVELEFQSGRTADCFFRGLDESDEAALEQVGLDVAWLDLALEGGDVTAEHGASETKIRVLVELDTTPFEGAIRVLAQRIAVHGFWVGYHSGVGGYDCGSIGDGELRGHYSTGCNGKFDEVLYDSSGWDRLEKCKALWQAGEFARDEGYRQTIEKYQDQ